MERTYIKDLKDQVGKQVKVYGFVQTIRKQGGIVFLIIRDVTGIVQAVVLKGDLLVFEEVSDLSLESVVELEGLIKEEKQAPSGFEMKVDKIKVLSKAEPELPIPVVEEKGGNETDVTKRLDWRWLDLRKEKNLLIFKVWTELEKGFRKYFSDNDYVQIYTPSFMGTSSETGADVFEVKYFNTVAYLSQSPQFYKQMGMACGFEKVFVVGPVFRAEPSFTTRHTTEFTGWDFEISYVNSHEDVMSEEEKMLVEGFKNLKENLSLDIEVPSIPFPRITMEEAKKKLNMAGVKSDKKYDLAGEEEVALGEIIKKEFNHDFVFVTDWPIEGRPFYHMRYEENPSITKSYDLLYKGLEITTGSQREHRYDVLRKQAEEKGMDTAPLQDYLNFFRYGCPPHGGAGIGPGRMIMKILNIPSLKEVTYLPRDVKRLRP
ncbi:aspartate--tRNA(Asn) ligase [candidate division WWE3 bacterium]|uniref:Aspartate--tRNA(Asp/Asn) ligase n=1 Tax=candidate division WWE3 bacterium TaxID=2053526 RepID=A0A7X9HSM8_UNCKA|nr:aspartate--tRNA(Asn) ligase [candidate division WWE3 bacterium]